MTDKTGEPVFPTIHNGSTLAGERGMTLRDLFAGMAMQVILKDQYEDGLYVSESTSAELAANAAYIMADQMLKAREAK